MDWRALAIGAAIGGLTTWFTISRRTRAKSSVLAKEQEQGTAVFCPTSQDKWDYLVQLADEVKENSACKCSGFVEAIQKSRATTVAVFGRNILSTNIVLW